MNDNKLTKKAAVVDTKILDPIKATQLYLENSTSENTKRAYKNDRAHFDAWCRARRVPSPFPATPETILVYMAQQAQTGAAYSTIRRRLASLSVY